MKRIAIAAVTALVLASCSSQSTPEGSRPARAPASGTAREALLITDLTLDAGVVGNTVSYEATLPAATVVGTVNQTLEASWNAAIHNLYAAPTVPQGWGLSYYAGATLLGAEPTNATQWNSVTRVVTSGAVTADGVDGERQALLSSISAPPVVIAASFSGGSAGDGWDVFFDPGHTRVFNVHHHNGPATLMCRYLSNSATCPGYPMALSNTPSRSTGRVDATTMKIWVPTSAGGKLAWDCADINTGARCTTPIVYSTQNQRDTGYDNHADPAVIGRKLYALGRTPTTSVITCLDMATATECTGVTLPLNGQFNDAGLGAIGSRLYVLPGNGLGIDCYDSTTMMRCPGTWPVAASRGPVWAVPNANGSVTNFCSSAACYGMDGTASTLPPNFRAALAANPVVALSYTPIQYGKATSFANKAAWTITGDRAHCWDMATDAACAPAFPIAVSRMYAPTFDPEDSDCLWTNGDDGVIRNWRVSSGAQGCSGGPPKISFKAAISIPRLGCDPTTRVWQYKSFKLVTPAPGQYTSATLTVKNSFGAAVAGWTNLAIPAGTATVDLTALPTDLAGSTPTFEVAANGFTDTSIIPAADFRVTTGATPQMCFSLAGPASSCPATAALATLNAGSTQVTPVTVQGTYTVAGVGTSNYTDQVSQATVPDTTPYVGNCGGQLQVTAKQADSSIAPGVQVFLLDGANNPVLSGGTPVSAITDAAGNASFGVWANVAYRLKMDTMQKYSPTSMTIISGGLGATNASGGSVTSNVVTPPLSSSAAVFVSVNLLVPMPPVITQPTGSTSSRPFIQGTCVAGATVTVSEGATTLCSALCSVSTSTFSCRSSSLSDGAHTVTAVQSNIHGDSNPSASHGFTVDTLILTASPGVAIYDAQPGTAVALDPGLALSGTTSVTGATVTIGTNFQSGDQLHFTGQAGITGSYDAAKGMLTLTGTASPAAYQTALASVTYSSTLGLKPSTAQRIITFSVGTAVSYQANGHFYEYISGGSWTWLQAEAAASARTYYGLQGYLVTISDAAENAYVSSKLQSAGWMGASAPVGSGFPRVISWVTGPEAGTPICTNTSSAVCPVINGAYSHWAPNQPDNANIEPRIQFVANGTWNDLPDNYPLPGYVVEYGGVAGDPALSITASRGLQVREGEVVTVSPVPANGTVVCTSPVPYGGSSTCTVTPSLSFRLASLTDNGVDVLTSVALGEYTLSDVTANHIIAATFDYVPPTINVSTGTALYDASPGTAVALDPGVLVAGVAPISGATVTVGAGFQVGDLLHYTDQLGITGTYDEAKGILTLRGSASPANYQTALASVTYTSSAGAFPSTALRTITFALGTGVSYQANSHFYEYVSGGPWTWSQAQAAAATRTYFGMRGYLTTIGDEAENTYVSSKLQGAGWMGATSTPGTGFNRIWTWGTGPELGTAICNNTAAGVCTPIGGAYSSWNFREPNNAGNEYRAQFLAEGLWNDLSDAATLTGYVVEYGGLAGEPSLTVTGSRTLQVRAATAISITSTVNPSQWAGDVTFTAHFTPAAATGTAQFQIDGSDFGAPVAISGGAAVSGTISILTIGTHTVTASYAGDAERLAAQGTLAGGQEVVKAANGNGLCTVANAADVCVAGVCDPDGKCGYANAVGPCTSGTAATVCRTGVCDPDGKCGYADGDGTCVAGTATVTCRSGFCGAVSGICRATGVLGCGDDRDCASNLYCDGNTFSCAPKLVVGAPLPNDPRHNGGVCTAPVGAAVCLGATCEAGDNLCGTSNNHACTTANNCRSGLCGGDGFCGVANGGVCSNGLECRTGVCDADNHCGAPNGGACTNGASCRSGSCGADQKCGVPSGGVCTTGAECRAGVCGQDGRCGSPTGGSCTSGTSCRAGACVAGSCSATCGSSADCGQGLYCGLSSTCVPRLPNGTSCTANSQCTADVCEGGSCGAGTGSACTTPNACRAGACVNGSCGSSCTANAECASGFYCGAGACVAAGPNGGSCTQAAECASGICNPDGKCGTPIGGPCAGAFDCRSGICDASNSCSSTCAGNADCVAGNFCDASHACVPVAPNGGGCANDSQCRSSVCDADGVCGSGNGRPCGQPANCRSGVCSTDGKCGTANEGPCAAPETCRSNVCDADGKCGSPNGGLCTSGAACRTGICNPDGKCGVPNGGPCAAATECRGGVCAADGMCGDDQGASCTSADTCRTGACSGGKCSLTCAASAECASGTFCASGSCRAGLPPGAPCTGAEMCAAGVCGGDNKCGAPEGGACGLPLNCRAGACVAGMCSPTCATDGQCIAADYCASDTCTPRKSNRASCSAAAQCASAFCVAGTCGVPTGQPCSAPGQCKSGICDDVGGSCAATCASNAQCASGFFCDGVSHACQPSAPNGAPPTQPCTSGTQCSSGVCANDGFCGAPDGTSCLGGTTCRGGACVSGSCSSGCSADAQCAAAQYCTSGGACEARLPEAAACTRPGACASGVCASDGQCGTPSGGACTAPTQCRDGACSNGSCGTACVNDGECLAASYCSGGTCAPRQPPGTLCTSGVQCEGGVCAADGRCGRPLSQPCAAPTQCRSSICSAGACATECAVEADCPAGNFCDASSKACLPKAGNGSGGARTCVSPSDCASGICASDGKCGYPAGGGSCNPVNAASVCRSGACSTSSGTCVPGGGRGCANDVDCDGVGGYCDAVSLLCTASKLPAGAALPRDGIHHGGVCTPELALAVCAGGTCDPADNRCGLPNARPCTATAQCRSGTCGSDGLCGLPNGGTCSAADSCRSGRCEAGVCGAPNGTPCAAASACQSGVCTAGVCGVPNGGPCTTSGACRAGQCGGDGYCGQPNEVGCSTGDTCRSGSCVNHLCSPSCATDATCAQGLACLEGSCSAKLPNGGACTGASQCGSGVCASGTCGTPTPGACTSASACRSNTCTAGACSTSCTSDANCLATSACVSGTCVVKAPGGASCTADAQCAGSTCQSGTCGRPAGQACQAPQQCQSNICDSHGTCSATCAASTDCVAGTYCNAAHACVAVVANGQGCTSGAQCTSGICNPDGSCGYPSGGGACTSATAGTVCRSGACGSASLTCVPAGGAGCTLDADCDASSYCVASTSTCAARLANGQKLPKDALHQQGVCTAALGLAVCAGGVCDAADDTCGKPNDGLCTADAQCRGGACGVDGRCGQPNGTSCTASEACRSQVCDADGKCGSTTGACTSGADCRFGVCSSADNRCGLPGATPCSTGAECRGGVCAADGRCGADTGTTCTVGDECRAGACTAGRCSASCSADTDCSAGRSCAGGACVFQTANGQPCTRGTQCASGVCGTDGLCGQADGASCTSPAACRVACTAGSCSSSCAADADCASGTFCQAGACITGKATGEACTASVQCAGGVCGGDGKCGALTGATCVGPTACRTGICDSHGTCADTCASSRECAAGTSCDEAQHSCRPVVANGGTCTSNGQCASGTCGSNGKCGGAQLEACGAGSQCQSGVCDARDSLCGLANGTSGCTEATAALVCRGGVCVNGTCGLANGATCGGDAQCASGFCSTARTCAPVGTNPPPTVRGGTGCSTSGGEMGLFGLLALAGLALRRRQGTRFARRAAAASAALLASAALGQTALVHGFAAQAYEPSYAGDSFFAAPQATVQGHLLPSAKATLNYGYQPVRILDASGQLIPQGVVVRDQLYLHLDFSLALIDRLRIDVGLPMAVAQTGDVQAAGTAAVQGGHLGDMRVGLRGSLLGGPTDAFAFGLQGDLILPTGAPSDFTGAGGVRGHVRALASGNLGGRFIYGGALGVMLASHRDLGLGDTGSSLTYAAGAAFLFADGAVQLGPELYGSTVLASGTSPLEAVLGLKYRWRSLVFGAAAGGGLTGAASAASFRGLLSVAWEPLPEPPVKAVECPAPVVQVADASTSRDSDKDGIPDSADACQFEAGVASAEPSRNGCPLDTDGDGLADAVDACPAEPGLKANKGCPPPPDRDHDGVADAEDVCPDVRGEASAAKKGCPVEEAELKEARIELAERVQFEQGKATLLPQSEEVLRGVAKVMKEHPELARLSIEGYTDNVGPADFNKVLSADRAASVLEWLVKNGGVDRRRMTSTGFGIEKPLASNDDEAGRQRNRRVEVRVLEYKAR